MKKLLIILLLAPLAVLGQSRTNINQAPTQLGVYVAQWGDNDAGIDSAIAHAGAYGTVNFTPHKTYLQWKKHHPLDHQVWNLNKATLQRQRETTTTITGTVLSSATSFTVASVPSTWAVNDQLMIYTGQGASGASSAITISAISGTTITATAAVGTALINGASSYASGSGIVKIYDQIYDNDTHYSFDIVNGIIDGNSSPSLAPNVYWGANCGINGSALKIRIINVHFKKMGNDCIDGHGLYVTGCTYDSLNNSFIHLSTDITLSPATYPSAIFDNSGTNSNLVETTTGSTHSEGVITFSESSGYGTIHDNWFYNGLDGAFGTINCSTDVRDGATREMNIHDNHCFNMGRVIYSVFQSASENKKPGFLIIHDNEFNNCGTTNPWPSDTSSAWNNLDKITWFNNSLENGTTMFLPAHLYTLSAVANVYGTTNQQTNTAINIDGFLKAAGAVTFSTFGSAGLVKTSNTGSLTPGLLVNADIAASTIDLTAKVTGQLPYANSGTNASTSWTPGSIFFAGASAFAQNNADLFWDNSNNRLGLMTAAPTHTLTFGSTSTGIAHYNTSDQTTNYERIVGFWSGNQFFFQTQKGGTGAQRNIVLDGGNVILRSSGATVANIQGSTIAGSLSVIVAQGGSANSSAFGITSTMNQSGGTNYGISIIPTINQTSAAGYTGIWESPLVTAQGSGSQLLIDLGTNSGSAGSGTHTSKFKVDFSGNTTLGSIVAKPSPTAVNASATLTAAQIQTGITTSSTSAVAFTMPTATLLATQVGAIQGTTTHFTIDNSASTSSGAITLTLGTGMTSGLNAGLSIPVGKAFTYEVYFTSTTTCVIGQIL